MSDRKPVPFVIIFAIVLLGACSNPLQGPSSSPENRIEIGEYGLYVSDSGETAIDRVVLAQPGWLCIQADQDGRPGPVLGCSAVPAGESQNVAVSLDLAGLTWTLHPALYADAGSAGVLEIPDPDMPVLTPLGRPISVEGVLMADPSWISVEDQTLGEGDTVILKRVYAPAPALLVIHDARDEHTLGFTPLQTGENLNVRVALEIRGEVGEVFAELHWDVNTNGELNLSDSAATISSGDYLMVYFNVSRGN